MNLRQIECFLQVARNGSFSEAAAKLYLSQSTVSQQVKSLETEWGFELLERDRHHVRPTDAGAFLLDRLPPLIDDLDKTIAYARGLADQHTDTLRLGYDGPLSEAWVGKAAGLFHQRLPQVNLHMRKESISRLTGLLETGEVDAVLTCATEATDSRGRVRFHPLVARGPCVFFPKGHRFSSFTQIRPPDLASENIIMAYLPSPSGEASKTRAVLSAHGIDFGRAHYADDGDTGFLAVQAGLGVFVASHLCDAFANRYGVESVDLDAGLPDAVLGVAWLKDSEAVETLIRCAEYVLSTGREESADARPPAPAL